MYQFNETAELFGAPPDNEATCHLLAEKILAASVAVDRSEALRGCLELALELQGNAYAEMLPYAFAALDGRADFEWLRAFFHAAAVCGEARAHASLVGGLLAQTVSENNPTIGGGVQ